MKKMTTACMTLALGLTLAFLRGATAEGNDKEAGPKDLQIPSLAWEQRSDWRSVKEFGAKGDGVADDSAAIQQAFDTLTNTSPTRVVYFPAGRYRVTKTLVIRNVRGASVVGHGRDTVLFWDGEKGGTLYWSNGAHYARYEGLTFDGRRIAANGVRHHSESVYETHIRYYHCAFLDFTEHGINIGEAGMMSQVDPNVKAAAAETAEVVFANCLFRNCGKGVAMYWFNDYDNWFTRCAFVDCGVGVDSVSGNFMLYACSFERSRDVDVRQARSSHSSSIRLCTSTGSRRFFETGDFGHQPFAIQDCRIDDWTGAERGAGSATGRKDYDQELAPAHGVKGGAIVLCQRGPTTIFDCVFTNPPDDAAPIRLANPADKQQVVLHSNNQSPATKAVLDPGPNARVIEIPPGKRGPVLTSATQTFLQDTAPISGKVFDARRDFGAKGDGQADDTDAIRRTVAAAREHGKGAVAYLPFGRYRITDTIEVSGSDYAIESTGPTSGLVWGGADGGVMMRVTDPQNLRIENLNFSGLKNAAHIRQVSKGQPSSVFYNDLFIDFWYDANPPGLELVELPASATVRLGFVSIPLRIVDCGRATILGDVHLSRLTLSGAKHPKSGFTGFLAHNDAGRDYALQVKDNQDVVIANFYSETCQRYLLAEGGQRSGAGRITIGAQRISTLDDEAVTVKDYEGRIFIGGGDVWNQKDNSKPVTFAHAGTRPVSLILAGNGYWAVEPKFNFAPSLTWVRLGDILIENNYPEYNEKTLANRPEPPTDAVLAGVAAAFDHFRELGEMYLKSKAKD